MSKPQIKMGFDTVFKLVKATILIKISNLSGSQFQSYR